MNDIEKQQQAIKAIENGENIFLTGPGGVGKSWVVNQIMDSSTVLAAPTGIAALNIGGSTCHKLFGLPIGLPQHSDKFINAKFKQLFGDRGVNRIIIDEIGMVRADTLELIDTKLRRARETDKPFGGIQTVVTGDFFQLEPIVSGAEKEHYYDEYDSPFAFTSSVWSFDTLELTEVVRQSNKRQVALLNSVRKRQPHYKDALRLIQEEGKVYNNGDDVLHLCCYNRDADNVNDLWYNQIQGPEKFYTAEIQGVFGRGEMPVKEILNIKKGCKVLITANHALGAYHNGDRGTVIGMSQETVSVKLDSGEIVSVEPFTWEKVGYSKSKGILSKDVTATFKQIPLKLGWAVSIHKSQGMTLDNVAIDIGKGCFGHGQLYVALSRVKDLRNIRFVRPVHFRNVIVRNEVRDFYE